ncbi:MAG: hypothetical protein IJE07_02990 [Clostridia bacterium]|nr:hypothetical protein [Clostridia bacterium]
MLTMMGLRDRSMAFAKRESIRNQFYSDLVTPLGDKISASGTTVHCFYAKKMGDISSMVRAKIASVRCSSTPLTSPPTRSA